MDFSNPSSESESIDINLFKQTSQGSKEPVAIVGIGCRFPGGASSPKAFWNMIRRKKDAIVDVPADRWDVRRFYDEDPAKPGKMYVKQGGFLKEKIDRFDPLFFGISPREAESMDPQQRLLLEVVWEAFEDGGLVESDLKGSRTGVFIGGFCMDSMLMRFGQLNRELANSHSAASSTMTMLSNRISYAFDLKGPSVTMDTACSSSLVATHYGCQSIWNGESEMAIVGGVNVMLRPEFPIVMSKGKFLSPHGRCKAFDADAAGYARGEGAGVVLLKPLSAALKNRDRIYGLIKETGINQDGRTAGITLPDSKSQETLAKEVYRKAGIDSSEIEYVEAHGTGTQAGDPAEINALDKALGGGRDAESKCYVGSVKTNIGHLEAAAGVAGLIKAVLSLHHEKILPNLHFKTPNSKIYWDDICIKIPTSEVAWKRGERTRYAGVNSFGYGGTNAHALLQEAPAPADDSEVDFLSSDRPLLLPISARSEEALRELAGKYAFSLATKSDARSVADFCYTAAKRRSHHTYRAAVLSENVESLRNRLQQFSEGEVVDQLSSDISDATRAAKLVFVYTGMGPQWWAMGRELMTAEPVFLEAIRKCDAHFRKQAGWSILEALEANEQDSKMAQADIAQPANFVIQVGLTELWKSWGIEPYAVVGHSVGEVASAYVSGALSLEDAVTVSLYRSQLQQSLAGKGAMLAGGISEEEALGMLDGFDEVSIAAVNAPNSVTFSGDEAQVGALAKLLETEGRFNRKLDVAVAYHSGQMDSIKDAVLAALSRIVPREASIPLFSTVGGERIQGSELSGAYWWKNVRQAVRFSQSVGALLDEGCCDFLEVGPHPVLGHSIKEIAAERGQSVRLTPSLHKKFPEQARMLESLGQMYSQGQDVNWDAILPNHGAFISLPSYPWQRERYWIESEVSLQDRIGESEYPLLRSRVGESNDSWRSEIGGGYFPFLRDHIVNDEIVFPGAGYVEAGLEAYRRRFGREICILRDLEFHNILFLKSEEVQFLATVIEPGINRFSIFGESSSSRKLQASGFFLDAEAGEPEALDLSEIQSRLTAKVPIESLYTMLENRGLRYGPNFQRAEKLFAFEDEFLVKIDTSIQTTRKDESYIIHPAILDTAIHCKLSIIPGGTPFVPVSIKRVTLRISNPEVFWCYGVVTKRTTEIVEADLFFLDENGRAIGDVKCLRSQKLDNGNLGESGNGVDCLYEPILVPRKSVVDELALEKDSRCLFISRDRTIVEMFQEVSESRGFRSIGAVAGSEFGRGTDGLFLMDLEDAGQYGRLFEEISMRNIGRVFYIGSVDSEGSKTGLESMVEDCAAVSCLAARLSSELDSGFLTLVTRGVHVEESSAGSVNLNDAPFSGLARLMGNEFANINCSHVDLPGQFESDFLESKLETLLSYSGDELLLRSEGDFERVLIGLRKSPNDVPLVDRAAAKGEAYEVAFFGDEGSELSVALTPVEQNEPASDEIEVAVHFACLSGVDRNAFSASSESFVSGIVSRIGLGVTELEIGDTVVSISSGAIGSLTTVLASQVSKISGSFKLENAIDLLNVARAYHVIEKTAKLQKAESILIHEATASFGLAAVFLAKEKGATVFATASDPEQRTALRAFGVTEVFDSETLAFVDGVNRCMDSGKVDVVVNSLSGERLTQSLGLLASGGRFVDVRRPESRKDQFLPISLLGANILIASVDFEGIQLGDTNWLENTLGQMGKDQAIGVVRKLGRLTYSINQFKTALEECSGTSFMGGCQVRLFGDEAIVSAIDDESELFSRTGAYLITGGTRGFGLEVAKWLADKGVGKLYLASRSGGASEDFKDELEKLNGSGSLVEAISVDISNESDVEGLMRRINGDEFPLKGIFHGAMVLDDGYVADMDRERYAKVMRPKILGALNLYRYSDAKALKFFVSFSSISTLVGNKGQANYIAANAFLDRFSYYLRSKGVNGITINWGVLGESGVVARDSALSEHLSREGLKGMTNSKSLESLELAMRSGRPQVGAFEVDWNEWSVANAKVAESVLFSELISSSSGDEFDEGDEIAKTMAESIVSLPDDERVERIEALLCTGLSKILKLSEKRIDRRQSLDNLGIDSLMLIELAIAIQGEFGIRVTTMDLLKVGSVVELADLVISRLMEILNRAA
jgi:acyl transferase domain-containing protein/NAD(P)-dependent dehydrogenase (short-subunit alcohol dehydrogenase family)/acyl carrier protein